MRILALDISTSTGWALLDKGTLSGAGTIKNTKKLDEFGSYPFNYINATRSISDAIYRKILSLDPDMIVIEETNGSKSRYTQKILEFLHFAILSVLNQPILADKVVYVNTSDWRKALGAHLSAADKKQNALLSKAKRVAKKNGKKLDKKALGIRGKINKKHVAIRIANLMHNLSLRPKDDDIADAICIATAYHMGIKICDGKK